MVDASKSAELSAFFGSPERRARFEALGDDADRVEMVYSTPAVRAVVLRGEDQSNSHSAKSGPGSKRYRELGNQAFKKGRDERALHLYSEAVALAPQQPRRNGAIVVKKEEGSLFALALANRSAALVRLGRFGEALSDLDRALESGGHPDEAKLRERRQKCCGELTAATATGGKHKAETLTPGLSAAVEIRYDAERGRYAVARRDIGAGEVLLIERAVASVLKRSGRTEETGVTEPDAERCTHCLRHCDGWQLPCPRCSSARFCSARCLEEAEGSFHPYECGGDAGAFEECLNKMHGSAAEYSRLALRAVCQRPLSYFAASEGGGGTTEAAILREDDDHGPRFGTTVGDEVRSGLRSHPFFEDPYRGMSSLLKHEEARGSVAFGSLWVAVSACFNLRRLQLSGYFGEKIAVSASKAPRSKSEYRLGREERAVASALVRFLRLMQYNTHAVLEQTHSRGSGYDPSERRARVCGTALYPTLALFNHSCDHNVEKYNAGSDVVVVAGRDVVRGEEVAENYFPHYAYMPRDSRRKWLEEHYNFECGCRACEADFPVLFGPNTSVVSASTSSNIDAVAELERLAAAFKDDQGGLMLREDQEGRRRSLLSQFRSALGRLCEEAKKDESSPTPSSSAAAAELRSATVRWQEAHGRIIKYLFGNKKFLPE